jgi:hypothetical protein
MSLTYSPTLDTDRDWVRMQIGDRDLDNATFEDEEIDAILAEEANKYLAAARLGEIILGRTKGLVEKAVGDLRLRFGENPNNAYNQHLQKLRERGAELMQPTPRAFRVL